MSVSTFHVPVSSRFGSKKCLYTIQSQLFLLNNEQLIIKKEKLKDYCGSFRFVLNSEFHGPTTKASDLIWQIVFISLRPVDPGQGAHPAFSTTFENTHSSPVKGLWTILSKLTSTYFASLICVAVLHRATQTLMNLDLCGCLHHSLHRAI